MSHNDKMPRRPSEGDNDIRLGEITERCVRLGVEDSSHIEEVTSFEHHALSSPSSRGLHSDYMLHRFHSLPPDNCSAPRGALFRCRSSSSAFDPVSTRTWSAEDSNHMNSSSVWNIHHTFGKADDYMSEEEDDLQTLFINQKKLASIDGNEADNDYALGLEYDEFIDEDETDYEVLTHNRGGFQRRMAARKNSKTNIHGMVASIPKRRSAPTLSSMKQSFNKTQTTVQPPTEPLDHNNVDTEFDNNTLLSLNSNSTSSTLYLQLPSSSPSRDGATLVGDRFFLHRQQQNGNSGRGSESNSGGSPESKKSNSSTSTVHHRHGKEDNQSPMNSTTNISTNLRESIENPRSDRPPSVVSVPSTRRPSNPNFFVGIDDESYVDSTMNVSNASNSYALWTDDENTESPHSFHLHATKPPRSPRNFPNVMKTPISNSAGVKRTFTHRRTTTPLSSISPSAQDDSIPISPPKIFLDKTVNYSSSPHITKTKPIMSGIFPDTVGLVSPTVSDGTGSHMITPKLHHHTSNPLNINIISPDKQQDEPS